MSIEDYFLRMREIADTFSDVGHLIIDEDLLSFILRGLDVEFEVVAFNLNSRGEKVRLWEAKFLLQAHETKSAQLSTVSMIDVSGSSPQFATSKHSNRGNGFHQTRN